MIFERFKEDVVVEKGWADKKTVGKVLRHLAYSFLIGVFGFDLAIMAISNLLVAVFFDIAVAVLFIWIIDLADESKANFDRVNKWTKFWFLYLLVDIVIFIVLKYFMFI